VFEFALITSPIAPLLGSMEAVSWQVTWFGHVFLRRRNSGERFFIP